MSDLLKINVNDKTERKNGLTYLSWAWAWAEVLKIDPQATWEAVEFDSMPVRFLPDQSAMVKTIVTVKGHAKSCWLPVMDHRNKAIKNPDAFAINTALVRCMTKCISMHGLGLYIYAGEDLPEDATISPAKESAKAAAGVISDERKAELDEMALYMVDFHKNGKDLDAIRVWYDAASFADNEERTYVWSLLATESKLRSAIKANKPEKAAA